MSEAGAAWSTLWSTSEYTEVNRDIWLTVYSGVFARRIGASVELASADWDERDDGPRYEAIAQIDPGPQSARLIRRMVHGADRHTGLRSISEDNPWAVVADHACACGARDVICARMIGSEIHFALAIAEAYPIDRYDVRIVQDAGRVRTTRRSWPIQVSNDCMAELIAFVSE